MGGAVSVAFAQAHPDMVHALVLIGPAGLPFPLPAFLGILKVPWLGAKLFQATVKQSEMMGDDFQDLEASKEAVELIYSHTGDIYNSADFAQMFTNSWSHFPLQGLSEEVKEVGKHDRPSLIMWGENDTLVSRTACMGKFEEAFDVKEDSNHRSVVIPETKHSCFLEKYEEADKIIGDFLNEHLNK